MFVPNPGRGTEMEKQSAGCTRTLGQDWTHNTPISERYPDGMVTRFKFNVFALLFAPLIWFAIGTGVCLELQLSVPGGSPKKRETAAPILVHWCSNGVVLSPPPFCCLCFCFPTNSSSFVFAILLICDLIRSGSKIAAYRTLPSVSQLFSLLHS